MANSDAAHLEDEAGIVEKQAQNCVSQFDSDGLATNEPLRRNLFPNTPPRAQGHCGDSSCNDDSVCLDTGGMQSTSAGAGPSLCSTISTSASPPAGAVETAVASEAKLHGKVACELRVNDPVMLGEIIRLNDQLRRNGFHEVPNRLETASADSGVEAPALLLVQGDGLVSACAKVLTDYEARGRRLRDALLGKRAEQRHGRDARLRSLLQENSRLQAELQGRGNVNGAVGEASASMAVHRSTPAATNPTIPSRTGPEQRDRDRELAEAVARARAAETASRHAERELERLRSRLEQAAAEGVRRQEREREVMALPLRRSRSASSSGARPNGGDNSSVPLLSSALAHRARADSLHAQVSALTKQVQQLTFQAEVAQEKCRELEAQRQFETCRRPPTTEETSAPQPTPALVEDEAPLTILKQAVCAAELRATEAEAKLHTAEQSVLEANQRVASAEATAVAASRKPSMAEVRWREEALRLRGELAESRNAWRTTDTRELMRRDKELRRLGLDAWGLEASVKKSDLVAVLLDACRVLGVGDLAGLASCAADAADAKEILRRRQASQDATVQTELDDMRRTGTALQDMSAQTDLDGLREASAQTELQSIENAPQLAKQEVQTLLRLCDERLAAQRIVDALRKLLRVDNLAEVLPALKEVLDVGALRRRATGAVVAGRGVVGVQNWTSSQSGATDTIDAS